MVSRTLMIVVLIGAISVVRSTTVHDVNQDRAECTDQLIGMATCLPYVGGEAKAPTLDCCSGLKDVLSKSIKCLCILVKDRDDPSLGLKINSTLALDLPNKCHHSAINLTQCIDLLKLPMSSPDAQMFVAFEKSIESKNTTTSTPPAAVTSTTSSNSSSVTTAAVKNDSTRINIMRPWFPLLLQIFVTLLPSGVIVITWNYLHV